MVDLGGGPGGAAVYFSAAGFEAYNLDINPPENILETSIVGDLQHLPLSSETVTIAHCKDVLVHIPDYDDFFSQVAKILEPKGIFILTSAIECASPYFCIKKFSGRHKVKNSYVEFTSLTDYQGKIAYYRKRSGVRTIFSPYYTTRIREVEAALERQGFEILELNSWAPMKEEADWYKNRQVERFVYFLRKGADF